MSSRRTTPVLALPLVPRGIRGGFAAYRDAWSGAAEGAVPAEGGAPLP